jgi:hypothetical protein
MWRSRSDGTWNSLLHVGHFRGTWREGKVVEGGGETPGDDVSHVGGEIPGDGTLGVILIDAGRFVDNVVDNDSLSVLFRRDCCLS